MYMCRRLYELAMCVCLCVCVCVCRDSLYMYICRRLYELSYTRLYMYIYRLYLTPPVYAYMLYTRTSSRIRAAYTYICVYIACMYIFTGGGTSSFIRDVALYRGCI
jgi:hypothetical protein